MPEMSLDDMEARLDELTAIGVELGAAGWTELELRLLLLALDLEKAWELERFKRLLLPDGLSKVK